MDFSHVLYGCSLGNRQNKEVVRIAFSNIQHSKGVPMDKGFL
jgi:hypothetical protein